jgi:hypothetical protein
MCCDSVLVQAIAAAAVAPERSDSQQVDDAVFMKMFIPKTLREVRPRVLFKKSSASFQ